MKNEMRKQWETKINEDEMDGETKKERRSKLKTNSINSSATETNQRTKDSPYTIEIKQ